MVSVQHWASSSGCHFNMDAILFIFCFVCYAQVHSIHIDSKVERPESEVPKVVENASVAVRMVKSAYEVNFEGLKKPVKVDCNQEGVICKFPLSETKETGERRRIDRLNEKIEEVPIYSGFKVQSDDVNEKNNEEKNVRLITTREDNQENSKTDPNYRGPFDVESLFSDGKNLDSIAENYIPDKTPVNVYLLRHPNSHVPSVYFMYHSPYDIHDHIGAGPYQYPLVQPNYRWTPFFRPGTTRIPHVVSSASPCDPPVYSYQPPPCNHVRPTKKPVINIDDKIDN